MYTCVSGFAIDFDEIMKKKSITIKIHLLPVMYM